MSNSYNVSNATVNANASPLETSIKLEELGEKLGDFKPYDSQLPLADIEGTRIVKCLYQKNPKTNKKAQENSYVRLPVKHLTEELIVERITELTPYVLAYLQEQENDMIRADHKAGLLRVYCEALSLDKIIDRLEEKEEGARLNKDKIEAWFATHLYDSLAVKFASKLAPNAKPEELEEEQLVKLQMILDAYKKKFASLASGKSFVKEEDCISMIRCIQSVDEAAQSLIGKRFIARLEGMSKKEEDLLMSL